MCAVCVGILAQNVKAMHANLQPDISITIVVQHCVNGDFPVESLETINTQQIQQNTAITQLKLLSGCFSVARSMVHII